MNSMKRQKDRTLEDRFMRGRLNVVVKALEKFKGGFSVSR